MPPNVSPALHRLRAAESQLIADLAEASQTLHGRVAASQAAEAEFLEATEAAWTVLFRAFGVQVTGDGTVELWDGVGA